jgi:hypothetical protein
MVWAHAPIAIDGGPTDINTAHFVDDVDHSEVIYHHAAEGNSEFWIEFAPPANTPLFMELGVPKLERFANLRPGVALLTPAEHADAFTSGQGLSQASAPFDIPDGYVAILYDTVNETPFEHDEMFTGTLSWKFPHIEETIPAETTYYLVGYIPSGDDGKFWMALGVEERYGLDDLFTLPGILIQTRVFHEEFIPWGGLLGWAYIIIVALLGFGISRIVVFFTAI